MKPQIALSIALKSEPNYKEDKKEEEEELYQQEIKLLFHLPHARNLTIIQNIKFLAILQTWYTNLNSWQRGG